MYCELWQEHQKKIPLYFEKNHEPTLLLIELYHFLIILFWLCSTGERNSNSSIRRTAYLRTSGVRLRRVPFKWASTDMII
jgi:hypothetical protein